MAVSAATTLQSRQVDQDNRISRALTRFIAVTWTTSMSLYIAFALLMCPGAAAAKQTVNMMHLQEVFP